MVWDPNDRRGWKYTEGGRPLEVVDPFLKALRGEAADWESVTDPESIPNWQRYFASPEWDPNDYVMRAHQVSRTVRHPADGVCYVFCLVTHPDQTEPIVIDQPLQASIDVATLVWDEQAADWRVHSFGGMVPPRDLGLTPYEEA